MNPTLSEMVAAVTLEARRAALVPVDPGELERYAQRILGELPRDRPKITLSLPELALKALLALLELRPRFG